MNDFYAVRKLGRVLKMKSGRHHYAIVYLPHISLGMRFKYRAFSLVKRWNGSVSDDNLSEEGRFMLFTNSLDPTGRDESFQIFALSCK